MCFLAAPLLSLLTVIFIFWKSHLATHVLLLSDTNSHFHLLQCRSSTFMSGPAEEIINNAFHNTHTHIHTRVHTEQWGMFALSWLPCETNKTALQYGVGERTNSAKRKISTLTVCNRVWGLIAKSCLHFKGLLLSETVKTFGSCSFTTVRVCSFSSLCSVHLIYLHFGLLVR